MRLDLRNDTRKHASLYIRNADVFFFKNLTKADKPLEIRIMRDRRDMAEKDLLTDRIRTVFNTAERDIRVADFDSSDHRSLLSAFFRK